jgi:hypothetical protein
MNMNDDFEAELITTQQRIADEAAKAAHKEAIRAAAMEAEEAENRRFVLWFVKKAQQSDRPSQKPYGAPTAGWIVSTSHEYYDSASTTTFSHLTETFTQPRMTGIYPDRRHNRSHGTNYACHQTCRTRFSRIEGKLRNRASVYECGVCLDSRDYQLPPGVVLAM